MTYYQPSHVVGFHSCDREVGLKVLNGKMDLNHSENIWDWLGSGIYFWEQNPGRALEYANESAAGKQKNKIRIITPFVIGAVIELGKCLNLLEPTSLAVVRNAYFELKRVYANAGREMPLNVGARRELDCTVIQGVHEYIRNRGEQPYDTVRSAFNEGGELYKGSNFTDRLHVELCVINKELIKGYFLPRPIGLFNPWLNKAA
ncbi:hypothetical protein ACQ86N_01680 [Puia sp. P3]|uniref:hypothetical protein n=1 Tax=Puia sp. P3 TaxID=3423952 RepID=UPI003D67EB2B